MKTRLYYPDHVFSVVKSLQEIEDSGRNIMGIPDGIHYWNGTDYDNQSGKIEPFGENWKVTGTLFSPDAVFEMPKSLLQAPAPDIQEITFMRFTLRTSKELPQYMVIEEQVKANNVETPQHYFSQFGITKFIRSGIDEKPIPNPIAFNNAHPNMDYTDFSGSFEIWIALQFSLTQYLFEIATWNFFDNVDENRNKLFKLTTVGND